MPPPSPVPGWARGEVCIERTAKLRTRASTLLSGRCYLVIVDVPRVFFLEHGGHHAVVVLVPERLIHLDQRLLLVLGEVLVAQDLALEVLHVALFEDARPHIE